MQLMSFLFLTQFHRASDSYSILCYRLEVRVLSGCMCLSLLSSYHSTDIVSASENPLRLISEIFFEKIWFSPSVATPSTRYSVD